MKSNSLGTKLLMALVCLIVIAYFGLQAYQYYNDPLATVVAYRYQVEDSASVTGWVVREEQVLEDSSSGLLRLSRSEGEKVSKGGTVATVYADQSSLDCQNQIDAVSTQIEQLEYARDSAENNEAALKLDTQISSGILSYRSNLAADRLDAAEKYSSELKALVLKRDYTYSNSANGTDLSAQLAELETQLKTLQSQAASSSRRITAPVSGIYSAVVDGYETVLTPAFLEDVTPDKLSAVQPDSSTTSGVGKLITGDTWYYAASVSQKDAAALQVGGSVTLRFAKGTTRELTVRVQSISKAENGRVAVVFSSNAFVSELTMLRQQSADIITETISGLRVPSSAVRVNDEGETGLYCVVGMVARFKPVRVLYTDSDGYVLVEPVNEDEKTTLRSGDEVILTAKDLYDGKVVG